MKIAMLGSGATGSVFASYLKMGGADDIVLVDLYKDHMDKVAKDGMKFTDPRGTFHLDGFKTAYSAENIGIVDIAIIMVKATQTEELLEKSMACIGEHTVVATLQNGLGNDEHVKKFVPADRVLRLRKHGNRASRTRRLCGKAIGRRKHVFRRIREQ